VAYRKIKWYPFHIIRRQAIAPDCHASVLRRNAEPNVMPEEVPMAVKILLDTDIGSDIDDAVCLAYLLSHPDCDLLGITTVSGEPVHRAMLASALCKAAKRNVPIHPGADAPMLTTQRQPLAPQARVLGRWPHDTDFERGTAVEFLRRTIRKHPGEISLLAIGPMTNIGALFAADPEIPGLLKELVLMCGVFTNRLPGVGPLEWNAMCDPYATAIVYNAKVARHRSIGLDVTCQVTMGKDEVRKAFKADILQPVADFAGVWFEHGDTMTFHDPLAATVLFDDAICSFEKGRVDVELASEKMRGATYWTPVAEGGSHEAAMEVDGNRFFKHYFDIVNR
jgi:purine nucleosidase